ncbi:MAG: Hsp70 family protein [Anaerolineales bacterium]|nr:Hsp70 family protein [Anaerolineales bacterium]
MAKHKIALDFGTTNSLIARWDEANHTAEVLEIPGLSLPTQSEQKPLIPSLLYIKDGQTGQAAMGQMVLAEELTRQRDNRLFRNMKRSILSHAAAEARFIDGVPWTEAEAGKRFLHGLLGTIPFKREEIEQLVVTVPVAAFEGYLAWLNEGLQEYSLEAVRVVDESTAAALGYSISDPGALVLVFDFGGGSLDMSLVQLPESRDRTGGLLKNLLGKAAKQYTAKVIAKGGLNLGGSDVDQWLMAAILQRAGLKIESVRDDYPALLTACEQAKISLSTFDSCEVSFRVDQQFFSQVITRGELEALLLRNGFFEAIHNLVDKIMHIAQRQGIFKEDIQHVIMIGGASLMPEVQRTLESYFRPGIARVDKPFTAVVEGALLIATGMGLEDYLVHSYGLRYYDPQTNQTHYDEIIPMGSRYPTHPIEVMLTADHPDQERVEFIIGEIETDAVAHIEVQYEDGKPVFVAQAKPEGQQIIPLNRNNPIMVDLHPPGKPGEERLRARFSVDIQRQLLLSISDIKSKRELLHEEVVLRLGEMDVRRKWEEPITGREPSPANAQRRSSGLQRLSPRNLGTLLNMLSPDAISLEAAAEALRSQEFYVRYAAANLLSKRGDRDARRIIQDVLTSGSAPQRASVAFHLYRFSWFVAEPMLRQALRDEDLRVRENAIYALCRFGGLQASHMLLEAMPGANDRLHLAAAWGLSVNPQPESVPVLEIILKSNNPDVRVKALEALGASQCSQAVSSVKIGAKDADPDVIYAAALSWIELEGEDCFAGLAQEIHSSQGLARRSLVQAFFHATNYLFIDVAHSPEAETMIAALSAALTDELPETRRGAAMPLAWIHHDAAAAALMNGYHQELDSEVKAHLLYTAVSLMSPTRDTLMGEAIHSPDETIRAAAEYLSKRGGQSPA